jgi:hypothetical protein
MEGVINMNWLSEALVTACLLMQAGDDHACRAVPMPVIMVLDRKAMQKQFCDFGGHGCDDDNLEVEAFYHFESRTMVLPLDIFNADRTSEATATLVHEMVHHMQGVLDLDLPCHNAYEKQAYDIEHQYRLNNGMSGGLKAQNPLYYHLLTSCHASR